MLHAKGKERPQVVIRDEVTEGDLYDNLQVANEILDEARLTLNTLGRSLQKYLTGGEDQTLRW
ncbi:hypothetical protein HY624_02845 [Candidatus Uhrbacteria bacterium]|nr:hypothetical protein [Candidatus Uhrbacteria bacterium]